MILNLIGDVEKARQMMRLSSASKPDLTPSYASFLNGTVRWDSLEMREGITWYVSCRVRSNEIEVQLPDDRHLALHFLLLWSG